MSNPNLNSSTISVLGKVDRAKPANTNETTLTSNASSSGHTYVTLSLTCTNNSAATVAVTVNYYDGTNDNRVCVTLNVGAGGSLEAAPRPKMILEGHTVKVTTGTANAIEFLHHYLDFG